ncbi:MAG: serine protease [Pseudomonadota bacterium]
MEGGSVPFIRTWQESRAFNQLEGTGSIHNFKGMQEGWRASSGFEADVEEFNVIDASLLALLSTYRRAVCKITCEGTNFRGRQGRWSGTGFLVGPNLLVTNQHVINSEEVAATAQIDFEFERSPGELFQMASVLRDARRTMRLNPARLFQFSLAQGGLDYTFVWIEDEAAAGYGRIPMSRGSFIARPYDPIFIIHHPEGDFKKASVDDTEVLNVDGDLLLYAADTRSGSSGAPVIARNGKLVGLHHAFSADDRLLKNHKTRAATLQDGRAYTVANEGIKFSAIAVHLESRLSGAGSDKAAIQEILDHFEDSDSITGPFGARGRSVVEANVEQTDPELAIKAYKATDQDVDIATWHMQWLNAHADDAATLRLAATVFADITQDVWVLNGITRLTATALERELKASFDQDYELVFAEDETHPAQPLTAIFFNGRTVSIDRREWPKEIEDLWRVQARGDLELKTMLGPIFPSFPALFMLRSKGRDPAFCCNLVPLFVGQLGNAITRRAVAARLMTAIVKKMTEETPPVIDWLVVGDVGTPLRRTRHDAMGKAGFNPILALDRERGGFSFLRVPTSMVAQLFVPEGTQTIGDDGGMITHVPKAFQGRFANALTGDMPYGMRISLFDVATSADLEETESFLQSRGFYGGESMPMVQFPDKTLGATPIASDAAVATHNQDGADAMGAEGVFDSIKKLGGAARDAAGSVWDKISGDDDGGDDDVGGGRSGDGRSSGTGDLFDPGGAWEWKGLGKEAFLRANEGRIAGLVHDANDRMRSRYGDEGVPLTMLDVQMVLYCEAGVRQGAINPKALHSLGERGLLPLPANLGFWIGGDAPPHTRQLALDENMRLYTRYMAALKAKSVLNTRYGQIYRDLFTQRGIKGRPDRQARLLAGIIHGYFYSGTYSGQNTVPYERLLDGYSGDAGLPDMLGGTGYVHAGTSILTNRQANIEAALDAFWG